jgi:hypothetical protein
MNYEEGINLLPSLDRLKNNQLSIDKDWIITNIALLPTNPDTLTAYIVPLNWASNGRWLVNEINHDYVYKRTGIYYKPDGTHFDDDLTFYVMFKRTNSYSHEEYKCTQLISLLQSGEIKKEDIPSFVLQAL